MRASKGKWFVLVLVAIMVASVGIFFAGCSSDDKKDDNNNGGTGPTNGTANCVNILDCPNGGGFIGGCVSANGSACWYTFEGRTYNCPNCQDLSGCAQAVVDACMR